MTLEPDGALARGVRERMRHNGVLIGTTGRHGNVLKIRPPLALDDTHVPKLTEALSGALGGVQSGDRIERT